MKKNSWTRSIPKSKKNENKNTSSREIDEKIKKGSKNQFPSRGKMFLLQCPDVLWDPLVKRPRREGDQSTHSRAEVTNTWSYPYTIPYICIPWCLNNDMENISF
jgi:hypothetical protein